MIFFRTSTCSISIKQAGKVLFSAFLLLALHANAQIKQPVKWHFGATQLNNTEFLVTITATADDGWHIYSQFMKEGGPMPTHFEFAPSPDYELVGNVEEKGERIEKFDPTFLMPVAWYSGSVLFIQKIKVKTSYASVKGSVGFMACRDDECLLPEERKFNIAVKN